jgi:Fur family ferric uptake transcriptional regulator
MKRATRQRAEILEAMQSSPVFRTAQELHTELGARGSTVGLTTVYRNLQALADEGIVDVVLGSRGESMFRKCKRDTHHHHLVCTRCRRSVEVDSSELEEWAHSTAEEHGFTILDHVAELFGLCRSCATR